MKKICVIAPHADDETLGCGGAIMKHKKEGDKVHWVCVTSMVANKKWTDKQIEIRKNEINKVKKAYEFDKFISLDLTPTELNYMPIAELIDPLSKAISNIKPEVIYIPYAYDAHDDHLAVAKCFNAIGKWFRYSFIKKIICYETLSETDFNLLTENSFKPNLYINISPYINRKIKIMNIYSSEVGKHPFPRSNEVIRSLALIRGSQSGFKYAEAFKILMERI